MKKIKKVRFLLSKNKPLKRALTLVGLVVLLAGGVFATVKMLEEKERVSAHPTNPITIRDVDGNTANDFAVPVDGGKGYEFSGSPYNSFFQTEANIPALSKQISDTESAKTTLFSSQILNSIVASYMTDNQNIISLQNFTSFPYGIGYSYINQARVILQSKNGDILDTKWIHATPNPITQSSGNKQTVNCKFFKKSGTEYVALYHAGQNPITTTTFIDEGNQLRVLDSDNDKAVDLTGVVLDGQLIENHWGYGLRNSNMSSATVNQNATEKEYYNVIEYRDGTVLDTYKFETASDVATNLVEYPNLYSGINQVFIVDADTIIGRENLRTYAGNFNCISRWDIDSNTNTASRTELLRVQDSTVGIEASISDSDMIYAQVYRNSQIGETQVEMTQIDLNTNTAASPIRIFPRYTRLAFSRQQTGYFYVGQINLLEGEFAGIGTRTGIYSGYMDSTFKWKGASNLRLEFSGSASSINITSFDGDQDLFLISGYFQTEENFFIDKVVYGNYPGEVSTGSNKQWSEQIYSPNKGNAFVSILSKNEDWAPLIKPPASFDVNLSDATFDVDTSDPTADQSAMDRWLLTGSKNGSLNDTGATKVYDTFDIDEGLNTFDLSWLQARINKNPKKLVYDTTGRILQSSDRIDWAALGFDKTKSGPQEVTYFVTDSQGQTSTASRMINAKTDQVIEKDEYLLDAQNFHIPLSGLDTTFPDDATFKRMAKTMAWNKTSSDIDEDGTDATKLSDKVTVDTTQLQALRDATVAKPYPVDVIYKPETGTELKNRVWVFVTTDNTVPNALTDKPDNGVVFYGNDYSLPFRMRNTHTNNDAVKLADAKVYDYFDSTHEDVNELPTLADANKNPEKIVVDLPTIQNATEPSTTVRPSFKYKWEGETDANHTKNAESTGYVDVELTGNALLHVRQVVLDDAGDTVADEIVVPTEGYFELRNILFDSANPMNEPTLTPQGNFVGKSGDDISRNEFTDLVVPTSQLPELADQIQLAVVVPEFYQYLGHYFTFESQDSGGVSHLTNRNYIDLPLDLFKGDLNEEGEVWVTMYIKPNTDRNSGDTKTPQPYSWDYEKNKLGKIKIP